MELYQKLTDLLAVRFAEAGVYGVCIPSAALLYEGLQQLTPSCSLEKGFLLLKHKTLSSECSAMFHCWVVCNGKVLDVGNRINMLLFGDHFQDFNFDVTPTLPSGYRRVDLDSEDEIYAEKTNHQVFSKFQTNPSQFWKEACKATPDLTHIRANFLSLVSKLRSGI
ncbi:hypothetical protein RCL1_001418 [Eukaryota sp. TZLM3-RCL]